MMLENRKKETAFVSFGVLGSAICKMQKGKKVCENIVNDNFNSLIMMSGVKMEEVGHLMKDFLVLSCSGCTVLAEIGLMSDDDVIQFHLSIGIHHCVLNPDTFDFIKE